MNLQTLGATVDYGGKYTQESSKIRVWAGPTMPTAGPETYLEVLEDFLGSQGLALAHWGVRTLTAEAPGNIIIITIIF